MKKNYHPDYEILAKIFDELEVKRVEKKPFQNRQISNFEDNQESYFSVIWIFLILLIISISIWFFFYNESPKPISLPSSVEVPKINQSQDVTPKRDLEHEVTLIKEVLSKLIVTVETLSQGSQFADKKSIEPKKDFKPIPFKITSPFAHLRQSPTRDSVSLATVQKDTVLIGVGISGDWVKTFAPSGKEAWVHTSVTSNLERQ